MKKIFKVFCIIFVLLIGLAIAIPYFFQDKIKAVLIEDANKNLNCYLSLEDVSLSFLRSFPDFNLQLNDLILAGKNEFEGDTLIQLSQFDFALDLSPAISYMMGNKNAELKINSIYLEGAKIHLKVLKGGNANWDITFPDSSQVENDSTSESLDFQFQVEKYELKNCDIIYDDADLDMNLSLFGLHHIGKGDFSLDDFILETQTEIQDFNLTYEGIKYMNNIYAKSDIPIHINMSNFSFDFDETIVNLNDFKLNMKGKIAMPSDDINLDLSFNTPQNDFRSLLSLVPGFYKKDFKDIETKGNFTFSGMVKGIYNELKMPSFQFALNLNNGYFHYPDLPSAVDEIRMNLMLSNPDGNLDNTLVNLRFLHCKLENNPIDASLYLKQIESDPKIIASLKGKLNLATIQKFYPMDEIGELKGKLDADLNINGELNDLEKENYNVFTFKGLLKIADFEFNSKDIPQGLKIENAELEFNPRITNLKNFIGEFGSSDLSANGKMENLLFYVLKDEALKGEFSIQSNQIDLNEWMTETTSTENEMSNEETPLEVILIPDIINFKLKTKGNKILYNGMEINNFIGTLLVENQTVKFEEMNFDLIDGKVDMSGSSYSTIDPKNPKTEFKLGLIDFSIPKSYENFITIQKVVPIYKFLTGNYTAKLNFSALLNSDMMPQIFSLFGNGNLNIPNATAKGFQPLNNLANELKIKELQDAELKNVNLAFSFEDGGIKVKPYQIKLAGIPMKISGKSGFDQSLDFDIEMAVPKEKLGSSNVFAENLFNQAKQKGVNLNQNDVVDLFIKMTGTITNPKLKIDWQKNLKSTKETLIEQGKANLKNATDSLKKVASAKAQAQADKFLKAAENQANKIKVEAAKLAELAKKQGYAQADKLVAEAKNPIAKLAAEKAAEKIKNESDKKAKKINEEADKKAKQVLDTARKKANEVLQK